MNINEQFLTAYKTLEETCRGLNIDIKDLASELDEVEASKLNISRQMRNYISHNSDKNFITATNSQVKFLLALNKKMMERDDTCAKHLLKKLAMFSCSGIDKCSDVVLRMSQYKSTYFLVISGASTSNSIISGVVSIFEVSKGLAASKTTRIKDIPLDNKITIEYVSKNTKYKDKPNGDLIICTETGEPDSRILGIVC